MREIIGNTTATPNPRPDWNQIDETKADYIKNKPDLSKIDIADGTVTYDKLSTDVKERIDENASIAKGANVGLGFETVAQMNAYIASKKKESYTGTIQAGSYVILSCDFELVEVVTSEDWNENDDLIETKEWSPVNLARIVIGDEVVRDDYEGIYNEGAEIDKIYTKSNRYYIRQRILEDCDASAIFWDLWCYQGFDSEYLTLRNQHIAVIDTAEPTIEDIVAFDIPYATSMYIEDKNVPDYWWNGGAALELETQKIDLTNYPTKDYVDRADAAVEDKADEAYQQANEAQIKVKELESIAKGANAGLGFETVAKMNAYIASKKLPSYSGDIPAGKYLVISCDFEMAELESSSLTGDTEWKSANLAELIINGEIIYSDYDGIDDGHTNWGVKSNRYYIVHRVQESCNTSNIDWNIRAYNGVDSKDFYANSRIAVIDVAEPSSLDVSAYDIPYATSMYIEDKNVPDYWWNGKEACELETQKVDLTSDNIISGNTIKDGTVTTKKLTDSAVTYEKLSEDVKDRMSENASIAKGASAGLGFERVAVMNAYIASKKLPSYEGTIPAGSYVILSCDFELANLVVTEEWDEEENFIPVYELREAEYANIFIDGDCVRHDFEGYHNEGSDKDKIYIKSNRYYVIHKILEDCDASDISWDIYAMSSMDEGHFTGNKRLAVIETAEPTVDDILAYDIPYATSMYIEQKDVPDYWWNGAKALELETQKVDLTEYVKKSYVESLEARIAALESIIANQ